MAEADTKDGFPAEETADGLGGVGHRRGIGGTVGEEDPVGIEGEDFGGSRERRHHLDAKAACDQLAQDIALNSVVYGNDQGGVAQLLGRGPAIAAVEFPIRDFPIISGSGGDFLDQVAAEKTRRGLSFFDQKFGFVMLTLEITASCAPAVRRCLHQGARIDALDADDAGTFEVLAEGHLERQFDGCEMYSRTMKPST